MSVTRLKTSRLPPKNVVARLKPARIRPPADGPFNLRVGLGAEVGFVKLGPAHDSPDHIVDTRAFPWPVDDSVVDTIFGAFYFHRLTLPERHAFMEECYRILKPQAKVILVTPYYTSIRAYSDPLAQWPPVTEASYEFYRKAWREGENMTYDLPLTCDFHAGVGHSPQGDYVIGRNDAFVQHAVSHEWNVMADLHATLVKQA